MSSTPSTHGAQRVSITQNPEPLKDTKAFGLRRFLRVPIFFAHVGVPYPAESFSGQPRANGKTFSSLRQLCSRREFLSAQNTLRRPDSCPRLARPFPEIRTMRHARSR